MSKSHNRTGRRRFEVACDVAFLLCNTVCVAGPRFRPGRATGVKTLRTQDTSDPRHFGTSAELSGHFGTSAEMSWRHFGTKEDTWALRYTGWQGGRMPSVIR